MLNFTKTSLLLCLFITSFLSYGQLQNETPKIVSNQVIVQMQENQNPASVLKLVPNYFELEIEEVLSRHNNIWLFSFNEEKTEVPYVVRELSMLNIVLYAQPNRYVQLRQTVPNDPQYANQWHHQNIDSELAWDITTGGTTPNGTDIVVALVESADIINHDDLKDNRWVNTAEIPNNGIDDDGNGYVDDYNGWNVASGNDNIGTGSHGTSCAGMIGAKGNNNLGVTGMNWDIKIMNIAGHSSPFTEANIIASYEYALQARLRWNNTNGQEGAFVVATSSSWGVDGGNPTSYPLWCNFYETLGEAGILNAGATSNSNVNVDVVGDVPSACPSDYMISVTASNSSDIIDFAAYGQTTIDLAAPGSSVRTTAPNSQYTTTSGTSFATPLTAGLIGLMYSIPCPNLEIMAMNDPQGTAELVRQALFDGVDQNTHLMTRTVTGGRINAKNSIDLLMDQICSSCGMASNVTTTSIQDYSADISFNGVPDAESYTISIQVAGSNNWTSYTTTNTTFSFTGLTSCTEYEYTITTTCDDQEISNPTASSFFTTKGCGNCIELPYCETEVNNPSTTFRVTSPASIEGNYTYTESTNFGGNVNDGYVYGKLVLVNDGSANPEEGCNALLNASDINGNIAVVRRGTCDFVVKAMNAQNAGATAVIVVNNVNFPETINMGGTNSSITIPAIMISQTNGNALIAAINNSEEPMALLGNQNEWIESFDINGNLFTSGDNNGYFHHNSSLSLTQNNSYSFTLTPGFDGQNLPVYTRIWLDVNQDGVFSASELLYDQGSESTGSVSGSITIPTTTVTGSTRMRVQMAYQGDASSTLPDVCGNFTSGEVEDFCVTIHPFQACGITISSVVTQPSCNGINNGEIELTATSEFPPITYLWNTGATTSTITGLGPNNYSVLITDDYGCDTTIHFSLSYLGEINLTANIINPTCDGSNDGHISVIADGGTSNYSYSWSNGASTPDISNLSAGSYTITVTDYLGCSASETYHLTSQNPPSPVANFTSSSNDLITTFTNTSTNSNSFLWDFGDGNTSTDENPIHTFEEEGSYNVCLTAYGDCDTITNCKTVNVVDNSSDISQEEILNNILVYPNPSKDKVTIRTEKQEVKQVIIHNSNGQLVYQTALKDEETVIKVNHWSPGVYTFLLMNKEGKTIGSKKITVTH